MSGRREHDTAIFIRLDEKVKSHSKFVNGFYKYLKSEECTATTIRAYIETIILYEKWVLENGFELNEEYIKTVRKPDIINYMETLRYKKYKNGDVKENSASIRAARLAALLKFYEYLIEYDIIDENPCLKVKKPKENKDNDVIFLTENEINKMRQYIISSDDPMWRRNLCIFTLGIRTGLRETSISEIDIKDINFSTGEISVIEKRRQVRTIYVGNNTLKLITDWMADREKILGDKIGETDALFISRRKQRISRIAIWEMIKNSAKGAGIKKNITPHKMRATCGTMTYKKTGDIYLTANVLGHSNLANTKRYTNIDEAKVKDITSKLDKI